MRGVEFLGGNCLAELEVEGLRDAEGQPLPLHLQFSLKMDEFGVRVGQPLRFALRADRLRVPGRGGGRVSSAAPMVGGGPRRGLGSRLRQPARQRLHWTDGWRAASCWLSCCCCASWPCRC
ncbi:hypothetical protein [Hylemonella gracilis]|uniref:hypothetical protein n=1 Tax=Hylemonella gracilis TaxID=80880 RepID=UPI0013F14640